jgi:hypothetical protein
MQSNAHWHIAHVNGPCPDDGATYRLELHRGDGDALEMAYVDVQAWGEVLGDRCEVLGVAWVDAGDPVSESAADALRQEPEHWLASVVLGWTGRAARLDACTRRAA